METYLLIFCHFPQKWHTITSAELLSVQRGRLYTNYSNKVYSISSAKVSQFWNAGGNKRADSSICATGTYHPPAFDTSSMNAHLSHSKSSKQVWSIPQDSALNPPLTRAGWHSRARSAQNFGTEKTPFKKSAHIRKMVQQTAVPQSPMENTLPESLLGFGRSFFWKKEQLMEPWTLVAAN